MRRWGTIRSSTGIGTERRNCDPAMNILFESTTFDFWKCPRFAQRERRQGRQMKRADGDAVEVPPYQSTVVLSKRMFIAGSQLRRSVPIPVDDRIVPQRLIEDRPARRLQNALHLGYGTTQIEMVKDRAPADEVEGCIRELECFG